MKIFKVIKFAAFVLILAAALLGQTSCSSMNGATGNAAGGGGGSNSGSGIGSLIGNSR